MLSNWFQMLFFSCSLFTHFNFYMLIVYEFSLLVTANNLSVLHILISIWQSVVLFIYLGLNIELFVWNLHEAVKGIFFCNSAWCGQRNFLSYTLYTSLQLLLWIVVSKFALLVTACKFLVLFHSIFFIYFVLILLFVWCCRVGKTSLINKFVKDNYATECEKPEKLMAIDNQIWNLEVTKSRFSYFRFLVMCFLFL